MSDSDLNVKKALFKLAELVKKQNLKIKKLEKIAQQLTLQEVASKLAYLADSYLMTEQALGPNSYVPNTTKVKLSGDPSNLEGELVVSVKGNPQNLDMIKKNVLNKLNSEMSHVAGMYKINMNVVTFINV